ncbi:MAG: aminotransferase class I/II-fold pyridoxal phosphate-dependent enzyme [Acidobacteria bacterium]|nr:aminotransferase class I/II-fold pyridoxal phosphate-dependent enzyme [Acidobacteriota bacterium]
MFGTWINQADILKVDQNERSEAPPAWAESTLRELTPFVLNRYPRRQRLESLLAQTNGLEADQVLVTNGSDEAIQYLFQSLAVNQRIILPLPTFGIYQDQIRRWPVDAVVIPPLAGLRLNMDATIDSIKQRDLVIIVRPNNPTGEMVGDNQMNRLWRVCHERGARLLLDEAYTDFCGTSWIDRVTKGSPLMVLRTFSKAYGLAGMRVGYAAADALWLNQLRGRCMPYNVSTPALMLAERGLEADAQRDVANYTKSVRANRMALCRLLDDLKIPYVPSEANFVMIQLGLERAQFFRSAMAHQNVAVRMFDRPELVGWVRVSIPLNIERLLHAVKMALSPQLVCLDVDGCLVDVRTSFEQAIVEAVRRLGGGEVTREEIVAKRRLGGYNDDWVLTHALLIDRGCSVPMALVRKTCDAIYWGTGDCLGTAANETPLLEQETREYLCSRATLSLVTGRSRRELGPAIELLGLEPLIPAATIDSVSNGKPDPEGILMMMQKTNCQRAWMVGDNVDDIAAAVAAGAIPIGVGSDLGDALMAAGAIYVLDDINKIRSIL